MSHPYTDIVIPVHNALSFLQHCVHTVCEHTRDFRIIFVDDFSDGPTKEYLQKALNDHNDWLVVTTAKQKWFTRASNLGLRLTKTERVMLLNSDTEVNAGWLQEMHDVMDLTRPLYGEKVGLVGSISCQMGLPRWIETHVNTKGYVTGHCYLLNMPVLDQFCIQRDGKAGWYFNEKDPGQININSDRVLCWDLNAAGYATIGCYHAAVGHHGGKSWGHQLHTIPQRVELVD